MVEAGGPDKLSLIVQSGEFDRVHYALVTASAALSVNIPVTLFFTMGAARALMNDQGWKTMPSAEAGAGATLDGRFAERGTATFEALLSACVELGATVMVCEMGLKALDMTLADLRPDVPVTPGGMVSFLADASRTGQVVFV